MKSMLISAILILALVIIAYKTMVKTDISVDNIDQTPPSKKFMNNCQSASADNPKAESYCRCLWSHGVRNMSSIAIKQSAQDVAKSCASAP